ncbi:MAG TPA: response regulator [Dehalococcoidia bacterium]|nr:response regulator [Dehalococcoidia bacterium]
MARVLVIDDDPAIGRLIKLILATENIEVDKADSGAAGLALLHSAPEQPDVILLDLSMPGMDGRQVFEAVRRAGITSPVIFCSAFGAPAARRELGAQGAIEKPFDPETLLNSVLAFTDRIWSK